MFGQPTSNRKIKKKKKLKVMIQVISLASTARPRHQKKKQKKHNNVYVSYVPCDKNDTDDDNKPPDGTSQKCLVYPVGLFLAPEAVVVRFFLDRGVVGNAPVRVFFLLCPPAPLWPPRPSPLDSR